MREMLAAGVGRLRGAGPLLLVALVTGLLLLKGDAQAAAHLARQGQAKYMALEWKGRIDHIRHRDTFAALVARGEARVGNLAAGEAAFRLIQVPDGEWTWKAGSIALAATTGASG